MDIRNRVNKLFTDVNKTRQRVSDQCCTALGQENGNHEI
jgi:hypothetical protein